MDDSINIDEILYAPLWLGQNPPAMLPFESIYEWAIDTANLQSVELSTHLSFDSFSSNGYRCCVYSGKHGGYQSNFDSTFPEVSAYLDLLPTVKSELLIMMLCTKPLVNSKSAVEFFNTEVPHMDPDRRLPLGVRYYMWHDNKPRLQWRRVKDSYESFYLNKIGHADVRRIGIEFDTKHCEAPVAAMPVEGSHAWVLSNILAPHNLDTSNLPQRCLLSIMGLNYPKLESIVRNSIPKYKDNILTVKDI